MSPRVPTLRTHLVLVVLGVLVPGTLLTGFLIWRTTTESRAVIEGRLLDAARVDAGALDREFEDAIEALSVLAKAPSLTRGDLQAFAAEARRSAESQHGWFAIILVDADGQQLVHTGVPEGEEGPLGQATDMASLRALFHTKEPVIGNLMAGRRNPEPRFAVRVPVVRDGEVVYALSAIMEPQSLQRLIASGMPSTEEWARAFIDPNWTIAARSRDNGRFAGTTLTPESIAQFSAGNASIERRTNRDGLPVYVASSRNKWGWTSVVVVPAALIDAPARASVEWLAAGGIVLMGLAGVIALVVSRRVSSDLASAREAAAALADGRRPSPAQAYVAEGQQLHASLEAAAGLLRVRDQAKDEFLAVLGHELRNPLAPATTALELMNMRGDESSRREREVLERQLSQLTRLVDDLLDVSRLTSGKAELRARRFELRAAVDRAIDMVHPIVRQQQHELRVEVPASGLPLHADEDRIVQILVNLLMNAARYTPPFGRLALTAINDAGIAKIACQDNGPGVAPELMAKIFDPFVQGPRARDRHDNGLGLGLAIARSLTELHGGTVTCEAVQPRGSRFIVCLPLAAVPVEPAPVPTARERLKTPGRRVLVLDDNVDAAEMLKVILEMAGHSVLMACSGEEAVTIAARHPIDAAVLDLGLPGMDGYEVARRLRSMNPGVRLVALTGYGQQADIEATRRAGFHAHCTKPVDLTTLLQEIDSAPESAVVVPRPPAR